MHNGCPSFGQTHELSRRQALQVGALTALGLGMPHLRAADGAGKAKAVILLWLYGGPSHIDLFDPKPAAPSDVRSPFAPIATAVPGMRLTELLPRLAERARRFALLRGMHHENSDHNVGGTIALTGVPAGGKVGGGGALPGRRQPTLGSMVTRLLNKQRTTWPPFMCVGAPAKVSGAASGQDAAAFGAAVEPFRVEYNLADGLKMPPALRPLADLDRARLTSRRQLLQALDSSKIDPFHERAFALLTSPEAKKALSLDAEPEHLRNRYGRTRFGQSCLLARRLVEARVPFVQVNWSDHGEDQQTSGGDGGWDHHVRLYELLHDHCAWTFDRALSALLDDLHDRGLLDSTLVLAMGEFGRTPKISASGGRDHWAHVYSMLMAGGGVRGGQVIGSSDKQGGYPADRPVHPTELHATVLKLMGLNRLDLIPLGINLDAQPVQELL
jgi:hypothetical protein